MKQIKIFLASSEELRIERNEFSDLILELNTIFESWKLQLKLVKWEHLDSSMGILHKQEEYNTELSQCEMCLVLYWTKCGEYTQIELDTAFENLKAGKNPRKLYVFFKDAPEEELSEEMHKFKKNFTNNYGHFYCKFANVDTMRLEFVMQFAIYQSKVFGDKLLQLEDEYVTIGGKRIVNLNKVPFIAYNKEFQAAMERLGKLEEKVEKLRIRQAKYPDDQDFINELQESINELNKLKEELAKSREQLFETAQKIAGLSGKHITERMERAITAFNEGHVAEANVILAEAEHDADDNISQYRFAKAAAVEARNSVVKSIEELKLKAEIVAADMSLVAEERISQARAAYEKAIALAREIEYTPKSYSELLAFFGSFSNTYAFYDNAITAYKEALNLTENIFGKYSYEHASCLNNLGFSFRNTGDYNKALEYYGQAIETFAELSETNWLGIANSYNNIGLIYEKLGDYPKALGHFEKVLDIAAKQFKEVHPEIPKSLLNIRMVYYRIGDYVKALNSYKQALEIFIKTLGDENIHVAITLNDIGLVYASYGDYKNALNYYEKALQMSTKLFGTEHPEVAKISNNLGHLYNTLGEYDKALNYLIQSLDIQRYLLGDEHYDVATSLNNIGLVYSNIKDYNKAITCYTEAFAILKKVLGNENREVAMVMSNIGTIYESRGDYEKSLDFHKQALKIFTEILENEHDDVAMSLNNIGSVCINLGDYENGLKYLKRSLEIYAKNWGNEHPNAVKVSTNLGMAYFTVKDYGNALIYLKQSLEAYKKAGTDNSDTACILNQIACIYCSFKNYNYAMKYFQEAYHICNKCNCSNELKTKISSSILMYAQLLGMPIPQELMETLYSNPHK